MINDPQPLVAYEEIMEAIKKLTEQNAVKYRAQLALNHRMMFRVIEGGKSAYRFGVK